MPFQLSRSHRLADQNLEYMEFTEPRLGTKHIHVASDTLENTFMVAFPTLPQNDDGRAHILEHIALCGSERFPVRNPFFAMTRRSLATYMNAATYNDRTVYPFSSQDPTDFFNLLDVYLDATFFPLIERHDFLQEGWRHEIDEHGHVGLHGVVFNEMKGAHSDPFRAIWKGIGRHLLPGTTYASDSGGTPLAIPSLTHEELKAFHASHYHPSRAVFYTFGPLDPKVIQDRIEEHVLSRFEHALPRLNEPAVAPMTAPSVVTLPKPQQGDGPEDSFHIAWRLGELANDPQSVSDWQLFCAVVMNGSSSPMGHAMENAGFGYPSNLMGMETELRYVVLHAGMEGLERGQGPKARDVIFAALEHVADHGVPHERLLDALRSFEIGCREIQGGRTPHGLQKLLNMPAMEMNGGDPLVTLDDNATLIGLHQRCQRPDYVRAMARRLLSSVERVEATFESDPNYFTRWEAEQAAQLAAVEAGLSAEDVRRIQDEALDLKARQRHAPDQSLLPKITPADIVPTVAFSTPVRFERPPQGPAQVRTFVPTNGVGYLMLKFDVSRFNDDDLMWSVLISDLILDLGVNGKTYAEADVWRDALGTSLGASLDIQEAAASSGSAASLRWSISGKSLERDAAGLAQVLAITMRDVRWDEEERQQFLIERMWHEAQQSVADEGSALAGVVSRGPFGRMSCLENLLDGRDYLAFLQKVNQVMTTPEGRQATAARLSSVHGTMLNVPSWTVWVGSDETADVAFASVAEVLPHQPSATSWSAVEQALPDTSMQTLGMTALEGEGQVNHCYATWAAPKRGDADCAAVMVLSAYLKNTFLHRVVREEGGAYGGSASYNPAQGVFSMVSFRDPRLGGTYRAFDEAVVFATDVLADQAMVDEAIVSIMAALDRLKNPRALAQENLDRVRLDVTDEARQAVRTAILTCTAEDLQRVARRMFIDTPRNEAAFVQPGSIEEAEALGMTVVPVIERC